MILLLNRERRQQRRDTHASGVHRPGQPGHEDSLLTDPSCDPLTERELDVLELLDTRPSNKEVATCLVISLPAVKRARALGLSQVGSGVEQRLGTDQIRVPMYLLRPRSAELTEASTAPRPARTSRCEYRATLRLVERSSRAT
jgi:hypothetical protein